MHNSRLAARTATSMPSALDDRWFSSLHTTAPQTRHGRTHFGLTRGVPQMGCPVCEAAGRADPTGQKSHRLLTTKPGHGSSPKHFSWSKATAPRTRNATGIARRPAHNGHACPASRTCPGRCRRPPRWPRSPGASPHKLCAACASPAVLAQCWPGGHRRWPRAGQGLSCWRQRQAARVA